MKKYIQIALIVFLSTIVFATGASAQRRFGSGKQDSATIAQRKAYRQQLQARYDSLPPEKKKEIRQKMRTRMHQKMDTASLAQKREMRKKFREKYKGLSPEERKQLRNDVLKAADSTGAQKPRRRKVVAGS